MLSRMCLWDTLLAEIVKHADDFDETTETRTVLIQRCMFYLLEAKLLADGSILEKSA